MIKLIQILNEEEDNANTPRNKKKKKVAKTLFNKANVGNVKKSGLEKLVQQIENNDIRYYDFPTWVINSWINPSKLPAIPLKNNRFLNSVSIVSNNSDVDVDDVVYSGWIVNGMGKKEFGTKSISLSKSHDIDIDFDKYHKLLLLQKAVQKAMMVIERKNKRLENEQQQTDEFPQQDDTELNNNNADDTTNDNGNDNTDDEGFTELPEITQ